MKLTKLQRYTAYCIMLAEAEEKLRTNSFCHGLCCLIGDIFEPESEQMVGAPWIECYLKELSLNLYNVYPSWMSSKIFSSDKAGWQKRIKLLKQCIAETAPK